MYKVFPFVNVYFNKIGDNEGSKSSRTFSNNTGFPNWIAFSNYLKKSESDSFIIANLRDYSNFLIHLLACP